MNFTQTSRRMCRNLFGGLLLLLLSGNSAMAIPFSAVDLEGTVGTAGGTNEAMIVIDWDADSFAWLYQWNGTATFSDAYIAIADSEGGAFSWTEGNFVETMSYTTGGQTYTTGAAYWLSFWNSADGYTWSTNSLGVEEQPLVNGGWAGAQANLPANGDPWHGPQPSVPIPEPGTAVLVLVGLVALTARGRPCL